MHALRTVWKVGIPYAALTLLLVMMTLLFHRFELALNLVNIALLYLFPVLLAAIIWGLRPAVYTALLAAMALDFYFVSPLLSFTIADFRYLISFFVYLAVAMLTASLATRLKRQLQVAKQREAHTAALYALSRQIANDASDIHTLLDNIAREISLTVDTPLTIYLPDPDNRLQATHAYGGSSAVENDSHDNSSGNGHDHSLDELVRLADLAYRSGQAVGQGTATSEHAPAYCLPLCTEEHVHGVLAFDRRRWNSSFTTEQRRLLEALGGLAASALDRAKLAEKAKLARLTAESERLRSAILDSVSHELRTPLAAMIGSATGLIEGDHLFSQADRMQLLITIRDGAMRMNRLVVNLLNMAQLESGMLQLQRNWCDVEDLIGLALGQVRDTQGHRTIHLTLESELPMIIGDEVLLEQMLVNILGNAIKYSPDHSEIGIAARRLPDNLEIVITDQGVGLSQAEYDLMFDKFYRAPSTRHLTGTGLGLAICKGVVQLHGGTISGSARKPSGTAITVSLPLPADVSLPGADR